MAIEFKRVNKHSGQVFMPDVPLAFEDNNAESYFVALGAADESSEEPVHVYPSGTLDFDVTKAVFADGPNKGKLILEGGE